MVPLDAYNDDKPYETPSAYVGQFLFEKPAQESKVLRILAEDDEYVVQELLTGFDAAKNFYRIRCIASSGESLLGYVEQRQERLLD